MSRMEAASLTLRQKGHPCNTTAIWNPTGCCICDLSIVGGLGDGLYQQVTLS